LSQRVVYQAEYGTWREQRYCVALPEVMNSVQPVPDAVTERDDPSAPCV